MSLLLVAAYGPETWQQMDAVFDWHRELHNQEATGHVLLAACAKTHAEMQEKLKINAELSFESVSEFQSPTATTLGELMPEVAAVIGRRYRWPWLWMEPQCVPLCNGWLDLLATAYERQPYRYFGPHLRTGDSLQLARVSIYPASAINDMAAKRPLQSMAGKCRLIQFVIAKPEDPLRDIRSDAVLLESPTPNILQTLSSRLEPTS